MTAETNLEVTAHLVVGRRHQASRNRPPARAAPAPGSLAPGECLDEVDVREVGEVRRCCHVGERGGVYRYDLPMTIAEEAR